MADTDKRVSVPRRSVRRPDRRACWYASRLAAARERGRLFFVAHVTLGAGGAALDDFSEHLGLRRARGRSRWLAISARAVLVQERARRLDAARGRSCVLDARRRPLERRVRGQSALPVGRRCVLSRLLPADLPGARAARPPPDLALQRERLARRARRIRSRSPRSARPCCSRWSSHRMRGTSRPRRSTSPTRSPTSSYCRARRRRLRHCQLAARKGLDAHRRRARALGARRRRLPLRLGCRFVLRPGRSSTPSGPRRSSCWRSPPGARATAGRDRRLEGQPARRDAGNLRPGRARSARRQLRRAPERGRRRSSPPRRSSP